MQVKYGGNQEKAQKYSQDKNVVPYVQFPMPGVG